MPNKPGRPSLELPQGLEWFINPIDPTLDVLPEDVRWKGELEVLEELVP